ncbi:MAG: ATP synthase subunit I [Candidatus Izemoplasma sp.]
MESKDAFIKSFPFSWIFTIIVTIIVWLVLDRTWALSFVLGSTVSIMGMSMLYKSSNNVIGLDKVNAQRVAVKSYTFRFLFYGLILVIAALLPNFEVIATAAGLFTFKIVFYVILILESRGAKK